MSRSHEVSCSKTTYIRRDGSFTSEQPIYKGGERGECVEQIHETISLLCAKGQCSSSQMLTSPCYFSIHSIGNVKHLYIEQILSNSRQILNNIDSKLRQFVFRTDARQIHYVRCVECSGQENDFFTCRDTEARRGLAFRHFDTNGAGNGI
jgi:hypothetical protein